MIATMTRQEQAEAYADLYDVPVADLCRRYGPVLLPAQAVHQEAKEMPCAQNVVS